MLSVGVVVALEAIFNVVNDAGSGNEPAPEEDPGGGSTGGGDAGGGGGGNGEICRVAGPDGVVHVLNVNEMYQHILPTHIVSPPVTKSKWGAGPIDSEADPDDISDLICESLKRNPLRVDTDEESENALYRYTDTTSSIDTAPNTNVGRLANGGPLTPDYTIVVRPNGTVASAYPGWGLQ
jgi:hypothetical protein